MKYKRETKDMKERENILKRDNKGTLNKERKKRDDMKRGAEIVKK